MEVLIRAPARFPPFAHFLILSQQKTRIAASFQTVRPSPIQQGTSELRAAVTLRRSLYPDSKGCCFFHTTLRITQAEAPNSICNCGRTAAGIARL
ncbi:hypothetical protein AMS68_006213 [Peltaster fructicola]|uniref:Uncharacterized protein n=1 Tax=Peltaster fructicola TaxID=286661 RepID=A0A6H0Y179_9PEZI|nr:hypothetical protein AMS68_006213 [Peltaster fructicola]